MKNIRPMLRSLKTMFDRLSLSLCSQINLQKIRQYTNTCSHLSVGVFCLCLIDSAYNSKYARYIIYSGLAWLGFRTVSYLCNERKKDLFKSSI